MTAGQWASETSGRLPWGIERTNDEGINRGRLRRSRSLRGSELRDSTASMVVRRISTTRLLITTLLLLTAGVTFYATPKTALRWLLVGWVTVWLAPAMFARLIVGS